jgi:hypothetical protein
MVKIHDKRNQNNYNVQSIAIENIEEHVKKINIVTKGGENTREYATKKDHDQY